MLLLWPTDAAVVRASGFMWLFMCTIPCQRASGDGNVQNASPTLPNGLRPLEGSRDPGLRKIFVAFFRFFHFALLFWNQTCGNKKYSSIIHKNSEMDRKEVDVVDVIIHTQFHK